MADESASELKKKLDLISKIRQQANIIHNVFENRRILSKSNFKKKHSVKKGSPSRGVIVLGNGMDYIPPTKSLKLNHFIRSRASNIIQDYDSKFLPSVVRKPVNFFPYNKYDFVGKRQEFVKTAVGQSTAIVPYTPSFTDELSAKYGMHGPQVPNPDDRYAEQQKERRENKYRYARLQASRRKDEREKLYAKAPWMKSLVQSGIIDKKFIPQIAKGVNKISKISGATGVVHPLIGAVSAVAKVVNATVPNVLDYDKTTRSSRVFGGTPPSDFVRAAQGLGYDREQASRLYQSMVGKYGPRAAEVLKFTTATSLNAKTPEEKIVRAQQLGLSVEELRIGQIMNGSQLTKGEKLRYQQQVLDDWRNYQAVHGTLVSWLIESGNALLGPRLNFDASIEEKDKILQLINAGKLKENAGRQTAFGLWNPNVSSEEVDDRWEKYKNEQEKASNPINIEWRKENESTPSNSTTEVSATYNVTINGSLDGDGEASLKTFLVDTTTQVWREVLNNKSVGLA